jgi:hypothetical protein
VIDDENLHETLGVLKFQSELFPQCLRQVGTLETGQRLAVRSGASGKIGHERQSEIVETLQPRAIHHYVINVLKTVDHQSNHQQRYTMLVWIPVKVSEVDAAPAPLSLIGTSNCSGLGCPAGNAQRNREPQFPCLVVALKFRQATRQVALQ